FNAWLGIFFIMVSGYTLFLVVKIYLGLDDSNVETVSSVWTDIGMLILDLLIILYSISTLMGSNAELLAKRFKRMGIDTAILWLIFSKVAYEFIHHFPYSLFEQINIPWIQAFSALNNDTINFWKNIVVLIFFIALLLVIGIYEIRKYYKTQQEIKKEVSSEVGELISPKSVITTPISTEPEFIRDNNPKDLKQEKSNWNNSEIE
ncbi:MAG: hypothetical protein ACFFEY_19125, partial [Candidatus Thorarchaeota archaeon]